MEAVFECASAVFEKCVVAGMAPGLVVVLFPAALSAVVNAIKKMLS